MTPARDARLHDNAKRDQRDPFQRDRDRILYCSAFRRLEGVTQVASASEGYIFHSRLTHSLKVAQIARRLAELLRERGSDAEPEVAEAAGLAHDLGHPPFGHVGESQLDELLVENGCAEGYEGNPQSFRILTRLALRSEDHHGLDLTRATLAAVMKYPWLKDPEHPDHSKKWAAYNDDHEAYAFAREGLVEERATLEAQIMDWADDIAYSVHDLEDFYRAGFVSWAQLQQEAPRTAVTSKAVACWRKAPDDADARVSAAWARIDELIAMVPALLEPFRGDSQQRRQLRYFTSRLIGRFVGEVTSANDNGLEKPPEYEDEVRLLKAITRTFVIEQAALAAQQHGQRRVLRELFTDLLTIAHQRDERRAFPHRTRHLLDECWTSPPRVVADTIASMTEEEVLALHRRLRGTDGGTVLNPIVR